MNSSSPADNPPHCSPVVTARRSPSATGPDHPWPDEITSYRWAGREALKPLTKVAPVIVVEVAVDAATQASQARHPLRFIRYRAELRPEDIPALPDRGEDRDLGNGRDANVAGWAANGCGLWSRRINCV